MTEAEIKETLTELGYEDTILYTNPSYAEAFMGVTSDGTAIYDYDLMVQCLMDEGMDEMDAREWIDYNCIGSRGAGLPQILFRVEPL